MKWVLRVFNYFIGQALNFPNASFSFIAKYPYMKWALSVIRYFIEQALLIQGNPTRLRTTHFFIKQTLSIQCPF
jgi:hypothetical protein